MAGTDTGFLGRRAEKLALAYLKSNGLRKIATNFRCRMGEVDLVMQDGDCLVFAEVRFRNQNRFTTAVESVDRHKQRKIIRTAAAFLGRYPKYGNYSVRFDVVGLDRSENQTAVKWIRDAFRPG
ncbi:MAG: YraN family protein [Woeseia sp.]